MKHIVSAARCEGSGKYVLRRRLLLETPGPCMPIVGEPYRLKGIWLFVRLRGMLEVEVPQCLCL